VKEEVTPEMSLCPFFAQESSISVEEGSLLSLERTLSSLPLEVFGMEEDWLPL